MRSRLQDGTGTTGRATVFDHRMREYEVQLSAANHISTAQLGGGTGVFTVKNTAQMTVSNGVGQTILSIANNDTKNLLIIDTAYIQIASSSITLPNNNLIVTNSNRSGINPKPSIINENRFSNIIPVATSEAHGQNLGSIDCKINVLRIVPTLGDIAEIIIPGEDSVIGSISTTLQSVINNNIFALGIFNATGSNATVTINAFIRFMMVPPGALG